VNYLEKFKDIQTFIFDVDGVLTNSEIIVLESGKLLRKMNIRDGYAIKHAMRSGYRVVIITEVVYSYEINPTQILYMGDDFPDITVMHKVGIAACPRDAAHEVIEIADYISPIDGGKGCARDVIEKVMRLHDKWVPQSDEL